VKILVVDVGGNNIKVLVSGQKAPHKVPSGPTLSAARMVKAVRKAVAGTKYDAVTIGFPGPVKGGRPAEEPVNLPGLGSFGYARAFGRRSA
jgi:predicted NBD/HSP70 family sugar kinase